ncbi:MAG TPA: hypothetical protein VH684_00360 [Xanthobacteraceae bacterium]|jgi:hypothetical protein
MRANRIRSELIPIHRHLGKIFITFNWLFLTIATADLSQGRPLRFAGYLAPILIVLGLINGSVYLDRRLLMVPLVYVCILFSAVAAGADFTDYFFARDVLIISSGILTLVTVYNFRDSDAKLLLILLVLNLITNSIGRGQSFEFKFDLIRSEGGLESSFGFSLGLLAIYFYLRRDWSWMLVSSLAVLLSFKRAAFVGIIVIVVMNLGLNMLRLDRFLGRRRLVAWGAALSLAVGLFFGFNAKSIISTAFAYVAPYTPIDFYLLGRYEFASAITDNLRNSSLLTWLFGHGPGAATRLIAEVFSVRDEPHDDHLRIVYEYGIVGGVGLYLVIFAALRRNIVGLYVFIYQMILFMTDNTLIYYYHWFAIWVVVNAYEDRQPELSASPSPTTTSRTAVRAAPLPSGSAGGVPLAGVAFRPHGRRVGE